MALGKTPMLQHVSSPGLMWILLCRKAALRAPKGRPLWYGARSISHPLLDDELFSLLRAGISIRINFPAEVHGVVDPTKFYCSIIAFDQ